MYKQVLTSKNKTSDSMVQRLLDGAYITIGADNTDYQAYLKWVAEGNTPLPADA